MAKIKIELMSDFNDCETCGGGSEYGGRLTIDDVVVFEYIPFAGCFGNEYYQESDFLKIALKHLGHEVTIDG